MRRTGMPEEKKPPAGGMPQAIPEENALDATLLLLQEGYEFISNRCDRLGTDIFRTRLMLTDVLCMRGPQAARLFYGAPGLTRKGSMPQTVLRLLQDKGSVQQLDDEAHRHRKALFVRMLMQAEDVAALVALFRDLWRSELPRWREAGRIVLFDEVNRLLTRAVCGWACVPLPQEKVSGMARSLAGMVENAGHIRPGTVKALLRRTRTEKYLEGLVRDVRAGRLDVPERAPLARIAAHRELDGKPLDPAVAAVELTNVLRPAVAVGRFVVFAALELYRNSFWVRLFQGGDEKAMEEFVEEVRRTAPFFPFVGAIAKEDIEWEGHVIPKGQWLLLDLYGTVHDERLFPRSQDFWPQRHLSWRHQDFSFIPQGAGETASTHRCPGEQITVEIVKEAARLLSTEMCYDVPEQDFTVRKNRIPALPESGFVITNIRKPEI
ncbi:cytochrome P450 [Neorhizobium sp. DT-125]|uniref:cytochrome P450 n=1 Tax=Neorhizobium sp. DT-125 TaxID=3396163 RepID=UPI003F1BEAE8